MGNKNSRPSPSSSLEIVNDLVDERELQFYLPNSPNDVDRQQLHQFFKISALGNSVSAPIEERLSRGGCKVLDVCCGSGTWLLVLESKYKRNSYFGIDFKQVYPSEIKPASVKFIQADVLDGLPFPDNSFDLVGQETMSLIWNLGQWDFILSEIIRVTKPGGYIQLGEGNFFNPGPVLGRIVEEGLVIPSLERNVDIRVRNFLKTKFESQQNIARVNKIEKGVIVGPNGGKLGMVAQEIFKEAFLSEITAIHMCPCLKVSSEEYNNMITKDLMEELKETKTTYILFRYWAQKELN